MLIKCPECGKEISDKSKQCIHCGFPLSEIDNQTAENENTDITWHIQIDGENYDISEVITYCNQGKYSEAGDCLIQTINANCVDLENILYPYFDNRIKIDDIILSTPNKKENHDAGMRFVRKCQKLEWEYIQSQPKPTPPTPTCPKCGSTAITAGQRGYSSFWGFLGSNKTVNRCANCGHTWTP